RPLLGSELLADQAAFLEDGYCLSPHNYNNRFTCPMIAATPRRGIHNQQLSSWIYTPISDVHEVRSWSEEVLTVQLDTPTAPSSMVKKLNSSRLPYVLPDGRKLFLRVYLIRPVTALNVFGIFLHGTHALMDARPTLNLFHLMLEYMSLPQAISIADLPWGTEYKSLPPGPMTATGGRRKEWASEGQDLLQKVAKMYTHPYPGNIVESRTASIADNDLSQRLAVKLTGIETSRILQTLKDLGYSFTHLLEAAVALATFTLRPIPAECSSIAHVTYDSATISTTGRLCPEYETKSRFLSSFVFVPIRINWSELSELKGRAQVIQAMKQSKAQYSAYLANPCLVQLTAEQMRLSPPQQDIVRGSPNAPVVVNLGRVEDYLASSWPSSQSSSACPLFRIDDFFLGLRSTHTHP
ncbi:hypothetical protein DICSQDRAFT_73647, partial [Dichomitus squalens LYAD-421 SS1]